MIKSKATDRGARVKVTFVLPADSPPASVVGDFNEWDPFANPLRRRSNGTRSAAIELPAGAEFQFRYLADGGEWWDEPEADAVVQNPDGTTACLLRT